MVAIYGGILLGGLLFALLRKRLAIPGWWVLVLLLIPMGIDGTTHVASDLAGPNVGFRYTNTWARLISGALSGFAVVRTGYPILEDYFAEVAQTPADQMKIGIPAEQEMALKQMELTRERI